MSDYMQRGLAAAQARRPEDAARWFGEAVAEDPRDASALAWLGQSLCSSGRRLEGTSRLAEAGALMLDQDAVDHLDKVLEIVAQLQQWGELAPALALCRRTVGIAPGNPRAQQLLALCHSQLGQPQEALAACRAAIGLAPGQPMLQVLLGSLEADAGLLEEARRDLAAVLASGAPPLAAFRANKELARVFDALKRYDEAFIRLEAAGALSRQTPEFQHANMQIVPALIRENWDAFDSALLGRWAGEAFPDERSAPAFVMGFYRSGTTLTQEVLAAHPKVFVADEAGMTHEMQLELHRLVPGPGAAADKLRRLDRDQIAHLRRHYWKHARGRYGDKVDTPVFVDKFTMNTVDIALINCVFPDAKVIFMVRDPRDVCLSCFMQLMVPTNATVHLLEWGTTADFYSAVMSWWVHIRDQLTLSWVELRYEDAVARFEESYGEVLALLGLDWDPALLDFHKQAAGKFISTPSRNQVAQPLYATSVERWRRYEPQFAAVADRLDYFIEAFGYRPT